MDTDGNAYIANRGFYRVAEVMKILATGCIDRNNNGTCETASDTNGDGKISANEMYPVKDDNGNGIIDDSEIRDERVAWIRRVGGYNEVARALAIDKDGFLWIGMYNTQRMYKMDSNTGVTLGSWSIGHRPYGAAVDSQNRLFTVVLDSGYARRISVATPTAQSSFWVHDGYGMAIGPDHNNTEVMVSAINSHHGFQVTNPNTLQNVHPISGKGFGSRGISLDANGEVLLSGSNGSWQRNGVTKARTDGSIVWTRASDASCRGGDQRGAIIDADNDVWIVAMNNDAVCKYSAGGTFLAKVPVGRRPYTYSDATGIGLQFSDPTGKVSYTSDAGTVEFDWAGGELCYAGSGDVTVTASAADTVAGLEFANPANVAVTDNGAGKLCGTVPAGVTGKFLQITFTIKTGGTVVVGDGSNGEDCGGPEIPTANEAPNAICTADVTLSANAQCVAAAPSIDNGSNDPDGANDIASLSQTPAAGQSLSLGAHTLSLSIADVAGESATCQTVVTVVDDTPPTADAGADQTLEADATCSASTTSAGTGTDNCAVASYGWTSAAGAAAGSTSTFSGSWTGVSSNAYTLTVCDNAGACTTDDVTFTVVDTTAPSAACGIPTDELTPPAWGDGAVSFTATGADNCGGLTYAISDYSATKTNPKGKVTDKTADANATSTGGTLSIGDSAGVGTTHAWTVTVTDASGNSTAVDCSFTVGNPGNGNGNGGGSNGGGSNCNNGFGNGPEGCSPDNGAHHDQDESGGGKKGKK